MKNHIKLIIIDFYGVMMQGSYKDTCQWIAKKYQLNYDHVYDVVYHKYFSAAVLGKITEQESFEEAIKELGLTESWQELLKKHLSFQVLNEDVFNLAREFQEQGITTLILSKNTPGQFNYALDKYKIRQHFPHIINTFDLKLPKASPETVAYVLKKFNVKPAETIMIDDQDFNLTEPEKIGVTTLLYSSFPDLQSKLQQLI